VISGRRVRSGTGFDTTRRRAGGPRRAGDESPALDRARRVPGRRTSESFRGITLCVLVLLAGAASADRGLGGDAPGNVDELMTYFAGVGAVRAEFESQQAISMLVEPLRSAGHMYFEPPDRMVRVTTRPGHSKVVVTGTRVALQDETGIRTLDLGAGRMAQGLIDHLMVVLRGDLPELRDRYTATFSSEESDWRLELVPRDRRVRAMIARIEFVGSGWMLESMSTHETNGDATHSTFSAIEMGVELSEGQRRAMFSVEEAAAGPDSAANPESSFGRSGP
jgi:outer membrane lipoprotein-sorting protein